MIIALDYDGTYTTEPILWKQFIENARKLSHKIICITMRNKEREAIKDMPSCVDIYYTDRQAKIDFTQQNGIVVDIWIDDKPAWLFEDAIR